MRAVRPDTQKAAPKGPGLSRLHYRWQRGWAQRLRKFATLYLPILILALIVWRVAAEESWRHQLHAHVTGMVDQMLASPELAVRRVEVSGAGITTRNQIAGALSELVGTSSMRLDVKTLRDEIEAVGRVKHADVQLGPGGVLRVALTERLPAILWRDGEGDLHVLDREGVSIAPAGPRAQHPELVVLLGTDAPTHVAEALEILRTAPTLKPRLRALIRVGNRRWDVVLDRDQKILLPEEYPARALARVMGLHFGEDELLDRDLSVIDMRIADRPVLRMKERAVETRRLQQRAAEVKGEET
ncbi:MAG: cell division protein FtsQ/DivIB [Pseudomonadota bacterium]